MKSIGYILVVLLKIKLGPLEEFITVKQKCRVNNNRQKRWKTEIVSMGSAVKDVRCEWI